MIEQLGAAGLQAIESLKASPLLLALVLMQAVILGAVMWISHERSAYDHAQFELLIKQCGKS